MKRENEIKAVFLTGQTAWNNGDLDRYLETFAADARMITGGTVLTGRTAIKASYQARFTTPEAMGTLTLSNLTVDLETENEALVFGRFQVNGENGTVAGYFTVHLRRYDQGWLILSDHTSVEV